MKKIILKNINTKSPKGCNKKEALKEIKDLKREMFSLQHLFFASHSASLLIIFQGIDTSGKDGVIRSVFSSVNPLGVSATSFGKPCDTELKHDFMWRIFQKLPERGSIQIFNRSYYEDILVPSIQNSLGKENINKRYAFINEFEDHLFRSGTHILKFYLHISKEEQKKRIEKRIVHPLKKWKYSKDDLKSLEHYNDYQKVYDDIINRCNKFSWEVIPADDKWYRNLLVARSIVQKIKSLKLEYPQVKTT